MQQVPKNDFLDTALRPPLNLKTNEIRHDHYLPEKCSETGQTPNKTTLRDWNLIILSLLGQAHATNRVKT